MENKRIDWIDISKYIAMVFVVLLHFGMPMQIDEIVHLFHMPVFFLISGYCFDWTRHQKFKPFLVSRVRSLLLPYLLFSVVFYAVWSVIYLIIDPNEVVSVPLYLRSVFITNTLAVKNLWGGVQWFLTSLFFVEILFWVCKKIGYKFTSVLIMTFSSFGFVYSRIVDFRLPLAFDTAFVMLLFYGIGYVLKEKRLLEKIRELNFGIHSGLLVVSIILTYLTWRLNGNTNVRELQFGNPILYVFGATVGSVGVILGAWLAEKIISKSKNWHNNVLYVGKNTIVILYVHRLYIGLINVFIFSNINLTTREKYLASLILVLFFFALIAYPVCILINRYFPILIGRKK